jgi:hypothetical protein
MIRIGGKPQIEDGTESVKDSIKLIMSEYYIRNTKIHEDQSSGAKKLHSRNVLQVLGDKLDTPSKFVLYYAKEKDGEVAGGTRTAVMLARELDIPTLNWYSKDMSQWSKEYIKILEEVS